MQTGTDPSHYLALLSDLEHPTPVDFAGYEEEDTFAGGANLFPQDPFTAAHLQTTFIPIIVPHLTSEQEEEEHAKDTPATRLAKAIGEYPPLQTIKFYFKPVLYFSGKSL